MPSIDILDLRKIRLYDKMSSLLKEGYHIVKSESRGYKEYITVHKPPKETKIVILEPFKKAGETIEKLLEEGESGEVLD